MSFNNLNSLNEDLIYQTQTQNIFDDTNDSFANDDILLNPFNFSGLIKVNENLNVINMKDSSHKIFTIHKVKRNEKYSINSLKKKQSCSKRTDNILRKLKVYFFKFVINLCNDYIKFIYKDSRLKFKNITSELISDVTVQLNLLLKDSSLKTVLYFPINNKFSKYEKDRNIKTIKSLLKKYPKFNIFLQYKIYELFDFFVEESKKDKLKKEFGIKNAIPLYDLVNKEKKIVSEGKEYTELLLSYGKNYFNNFNREKQRKRQTKKNVLEKLIEIMKKNQD
jgi:hypothetical protein